MSEEIMLKGLFVAILSLGIAWVVFSRYDTEIGSESKDNDSQRYLPYIPGSLLPLCLLTLVVLEFIFYGVQEVVQMTLSVCFGIFLHISLYYALLMLVLPFFRRYISARACSMLWMLPGYLYISLQKTMIVPNPLLVIRVPKRLVWILFLVWLAGFLGILFWKTISHLVFRFRILKDALTVTDQTILAIWDKELESARISKARFKLVISPVVATPLSIGLFRRTTQVVLPKRNYTPEELSLILRHEIIHIGREDSWSKFFLVFCTAMCWFNPLMWMAMRKSADDLELSCDETVLLDSDEDTRRQYANLVLNTAGDERGFTTCLSASASAMRYRLKNIMKPKKRHSGALTVGLVFFLLYMSCGYVSLAYSDGTGAEVLYQSRDTELYTVRYITMADNPYNTTFELTDPEAFHAYLSNLTMDRFTGNYSFTEKERQYTFLYDTPEGTLSVTLSDHVIKLTPLYGEGRTSSYYYLPEGANWEYLDTIIAAYPALNVTVFEPDDTYGKKIPASLQTVWKLTNDNTAIIYQAETPQENPSGIFGYEPYKAMLSFSHELVSEYIVTIESWDRQSSYTVAQSDAEQNFTIPLPAYPAHYTVRAAFQDPNNDIYEAEFRFDIGDIDSQ